MAGGGKGSSGGSGAYDYYGTIAGLVCAGPVDYLLGVIVDGKDMWPGATAWASGSAYVVNDIRAYGPKTWKCVLNHTSSSGNAPPNVTYWVEYSLARGVADYTDVTIANIGTMRIYWGTQTQAQDSLLASAGNNFSEDHPAYKGQCYIVLRDCLFGRERTSAPNVEIVVRKAAAQTVITSTPTNIQDDQVNPAVAVIALATDVVNGVGVSTSLIDATSWQAAAASLSGVNGNTYVSTLLDQQTTLRDLAEQLGLISDLWVRFNAATKKIEAGYWQHGSEPLVFATLGIDDIAEGQHPQFTAGGWKDAKTGAVVVFSDRERAYKQSSDKVDDLRAVAVLGENRRDNLQRPFITRRAQALQHAAETLRTIGRPQLDGTIIVRREKARNIKVGDWLKFDIDVEPGGSQLLQFFRVAEKRIPYRGPVTLTLDADETLTPVPYTPPAGTPAVLPSSAPAALTAIRIFSPPHVLTQATGEWVCILAQRPDALIVGAEVSFESNNVSPEWLDIGRLDTFAIKGQLHTSYNSSATGTIDVEIDTQTDIGRLSDPISRIAPADDDLLLILMQRSGTQIENDTTTGQSILEIFSVSDIAIPGSGNVYTFTVLRARQGTTQRSFVTTGDGTEAWIVSRASMRFFTHGDMERLATLAASDATTEYPGYFLLQSMNPFAMQDAASGSQVTYDFPHGRHDAPTMAWIVPDITVTGWNGRTHSFATSPQSIQLKGGWTDLDSDMLTISIITRQSGGAEVVQWSQDVGFSGNAAFDINVTLSSGEYSIIARATDAAGNTVDDVLSVCIALGASTVQTPYAGASSGHPVTSIVGTQAELNKLFCDTASSSIEYRFGDWYGDTPGGGWLSYTPGTTLDLLTGYSVPSRLYFRGTRGGWTTSAEGYLKIARG